MDTPSGVEDVLESTRVPNSHNNSRPSVTSDISGISSASQMGNNSVFGDNHNSRQSPEEMAEALSQAVDDLDLTADTQVWAENAAVDLSPNLTENHSTMSHSGTEGPIGNHSHNSASRASLPRTNSTTSVRSTRSNVDQQHNSTSRESLPRTSSNASSVRSTQSKGPFICEQCQKHCASKSGLKSHARVHK